ncbi:MAG: DMT family transporter [Promethearchaeota archaeon]
MEDEKENSTPRRRIIAIIFLILTNVLWGTSFIITKIITEEVPIFLYLGLRFLIALFGFIPFFLHFKNVNKRIIWMGVVSGFLYFFGIAFQSYGLQTTTARKAGFITGLSTVIVPFITWVMYKKPLKGRIWIAVALSVSGMAFLLLEGQSGFVIGDILVLICSFFWAFYIVFNDKYVKLNDVFLYSVIQISLISGISFISSLIVGESYDISNFSLSIWLILIYMGIIVITLTFLFQNWGQQYQGPAQTAIIFTLEPVFAALFDFLIANGIFTPYGWIGSSMIFIAILITVLKSNKVDKKSIVKPNSIN